MSSAHIIMLIKDLTTDSNGIADHPDLYDENGNKLGPTNIVGSAGQTVYSKAFALMPKYNDYIVTAVCAATSCSAKVTLEYSPDGIHWCDCALADGNTCTFKCDVTISRCTAKIVDVPLLQYVRVRLEEIPAETIDCSIMITHTMNY